MTPIYTSEELIELSEIIGDNNRYSTLSIPFYIGQNNLIRYIDREIESWTNNLKNENKFSIMTAKKAIIELEIFKTVLFCDKEDLPLHIHSRFKKIIQWRLIKDK